MQFQSVLFDLDGTLLDTLADLADSANLALDRLGFPRHPADAYKIFVGDGVETLMRRIIPAERCDAQTLARGCQLMRDEYSQRWNQKTCPYDGVAELLDALTTRRIRMAVLSNKPDDFTKLCVSQILPQWRFEVVQGGSAAIPKKPHPAGALEIAKRLQLAPEQVLYLGDTNTDMQTAVAAGMYAVGALWGFRTAEELLAHGAQVLIERPQDLLRLLDSGIEA